MNAPSTLPMGSADAAWLHMDRPTNQMVINALIRLKQPLNLDALHQVIEARLMGPYPKFAMLVKEGGPLPMRAPVPIGLPLPLSRLRWETDPSFHLSRHLHLIALPSPHDEEALRALTGDLISMPLPHDRPLWQMHVIETGGGAPPALLVRMHHCIADGIALARVLLSLTDEAAQTKPSRAAPKAAPINHDPGRLTDGNGASPLRDGPPPQAKRPLTEGNGASPLHPLSLAGGALSALAHPRRTAQAAVKDTIEGARGAAVLMRLLLIPPDPEGPLKQPLSGARKVGWCPPLSLPKVKEVAHRHRATVNDVLLSVVTGALRNQMLMIDGLPSHMRAIVPYNLRPLSEPIPSHLGNRFGLVFLDLPVEVGDRRRRLLTVKTRMDAIKRSPGGIVSYRVLQAIGLAPHEVESRFVSLFSSKGTAVMTNVRGPSEARALAGSEVDGLQVWAPTSGSVGLSVSILSYNGRVSVGLMSDESLACDPEAIAEAMKGELNALSALKPKGGGGGRVAA